MLKTRGEHHYWKRLIDLNLHSHLKFLFFKAAVHQRLAEQTLLTLAGFVDWVKFGTLYIKNCIILQMLCLLLEEDSLKIPSCECLLIIVSRKVITTNNNISLFNNVHFIWWFDIKYALMFCKLCCIFQSPKGQGKYEQQFIIPLLFHFLAFRF